MVVGGRICIFIGRRVAGFPFPLFREMRDDEVGPDVEVNSCRLLLTFRVVEFPGVVYVRGDGVVVFDVRGAVIAYY